MENDIIKFLGIKDAGIKVVSTALTNKSRTITIEKTLTTHYCKACSCRMYSKGVYRRTVNHPIMQDGRQVVLKINQRRWQCTNKSCHEVETDKFSFIDKYRRNTNLSDLLIVQAFKNPFESAASIARRFNVSDTHAITTFARYVDMPRRQLTEIISIDEVHLNISKQCNYALVIQDFISGEPLDLVINRREEYTFPYFANIPINERKRVKYIISDMYKPYMSYIDKYFPNAVSAIDAFHVIQLINRHITKYIRALQRRIDENDRLIHEQKELRQGYSIPFFHSDDYYILKKYHWIILKNRDDIKYFSNPKFNSRLKRFMNTYDYEEWLFRIDPNLKELRSLKEKYIRFNKQYAGKPKGARSALRDIIDFYRESRFEMFRNIAGTLTEFFEPIINSFIIVERIGKDGPYSTRLSNGPIESLNRIPKDMKRIGRGYLNFEHLRNRFLFSQRHNAAILSTPKPLALVQAKKIYPRK